MLDGSALSIAELTSHIADGSLSARQVTDWCLMRAVDVNARTGCFIGLEEAEARLAADNVDNGHARGGGLEGVPFAYKDIFAWRGRGPSAGVAGAEIPLRCASATVLDRLEQAGSVGIGRLNMDQFAYAALGMNPDFGDTRNPWDTTRAAGGSSAGAAVAVAADSVSFAVGSDTGGSVRIPASFCGVVGLKPTFGRVPRRGSLPLSYSQDTIGIITRSVTDAARVLDVIAGHDPQDAASLNVPTQNYSKAAEDAWDHPGDQLSGLRIGFDQQYLDGHCSADVRQVIAAALGVLAALGSGIRQVDLAPLARYDVGATVLTWAEAGAIHRKMLVADGTGYDGAFQARLQTALTSRGVHHVDALRFQGRALKQFTDDLMSGVDVLVTSTTSSTAPALDMLHAAPDSEVVEASLALLRLNRPFNYIGVPAMTIPAGFDAAGLPVGLQIVARPWQESLLLRVGAAFQAGTDWHLRMPSVTVSPSPGSTGDEEST